jgi:hypothetical protein
MAQDGTTLTTSEGIQGPLARSFNLGIDRLGVHDK